MYAAGYTKSPQSCDFPLDSLFRVSRSLGYSLREVPAQRHARVHPYAIGREPIKNHFTSRDRPSRPLSESAKTRV